LRIIRQFYRLAISFRRSKSLKTKFFTCRNSYTYKSTCFFLAPYEPP